MSFNNVQVFTCDLCGAKAEVGGTITRYPDGWIKISAEHPRPRIPIDRIKYDLCSWYCVYNFGYGKDDGSIE